LSEEDAGRLMLFLTASVADLLETRFETDEVKNLIGCSNVLGAHNGPMTPCSASGLMFHSMPGGDDLSQGYMGHVHGGMGTISEALGAAARAVGGARAHAVAEGDDARRALRLHRLPRARLPRARLGRREARTGVRRALRRLRRAHARRPDPRSPGPCRADRLRAVRSVSS